MKRIILSALMPVFVLTLVVTGCKSSSKNPAPSSSDSSLKSLTVSAGTLSPAFASGTLAYAVVVPDGTSSVTVTPVTSSWHATIKVNNGTVSSGSPSGPWDVPATGPFDVTIVVTAEDGVHASTYVVTLTHSATVLSADANLSALTISAGTLTPAFASATTDYSVVAPNGTATVTVTPTANESHANIQVNGAAVASGGASQAITVPAAGSPAATISIVVTAQDGTTTKTYTISLTQALSADANLSALTISAGALTPAFASGTTSYSVVAPNGTATVTVTPTRSESHATITVNGAAVASGSASQTIAVPAVGASAATISIVVTAQNSGTKTYTISLTQAPAGASSDANLSALTISAGTLTPAFASGTVNYSATAPAGTATVTVTPTRNESHATITVNGATVASGSPSQAITVPAAGSTVDIHIVVTAQDGSTQKDYKITLGQAPSTNATLSALTISAGTLTPAFASATTDYSATAPNGTATVTVTPTVGESHATITVNGATVASGSASQAITVPASGSTVDIHIVVTAQDGSTQKDYKITLGQAPSTDATLSALTISAGTLTPAFASATTDYSATAPNGTPTVTVTPTVSESHATVTVNGATVASGSASNPITVPAAGSTVDIHIVVTAQDGATQKDYKITLSGPSSTDATLSALTISAGTLTPAFASATTDYGAAAPNGTATVTVTPTVSESHATVTVNGSTVASGSASQAINVPAVGSTATISIVVTAQDGTTTKTYTIALSQTGMLIFVKQANGTANYTQPSGGAFTVTASYSTSGNAFKYVAPNYYGTNSNGFVCLPYTLSGDFTMNGTINVTAANKVNTACGIGMGITTGFLATDRYAYAILPTSGAGSTRYVNSATNVTNVTPPTVTFTIPTASPYLNVTFSRSGSNYSLGFTNGGGTTATIPASSFTDGTTVYGAGAVYPCISFNNINATISNFTITDGAGHTLYDSATGPIVTYVPAALTLSSSTALVLRTQTTDVTATATAIGGAVATVSAVAADPSIVGVSVTNGPSNSTITLTGYNTGSTNVTVTNNGDPNPATNTKTIAVTVEEFNTSDPSYGSLAGRLYPAQGEQNAYADGELSITFDTPPTLNTGGSIDLYNADGTLADRVFYANESQIVSGVTVKVQDQLARVNGNTVYFTPHFLKLVYGSSYYVGISTTAITGTINGHSFTGFSNLPSVATWNFKVQAAPSLSPATPITVDGSQTSTANFRTLGGALMYLAGHPFSHPVGTPTAVTINVAAGTYIELVNYRATADPDLTITISGPAGNTRGDNTVIQYTNGGSWNSSQNARASFYFAGASLVLQNLTLQNTGVRSVVAQAEAMYFDSRTGYTMAANNCSFKSHQDTINTTGRAWIYNSNIEGNTDFIWGTSDAALFENCDLRVINDSAGQTYSIFVARTGTTGAATLGKGYVLLNSRVSVDAGIFAAYGRDAGTGSFYDQVALINNLFSSPGDGQLAAGLWVVTTAPLRIGDSSYVGWKSSGNTGLGADTGNATCGASPACTTLTIAAMASEYDTRNHILNRVVTISGGVPTGFQDVATAWDTSALATAWGAP